VPTRCKAGYDHRTQFFFKNPGVTLGYASDRDGIYRLDNHDANMAFYVYPVSENLLAFGPRRSKESDHPSDAHIQQSFIDCWNNTVALRKPDLHLSERFFVHCRHTRTAHITDPCSHSDTSIRTPLLDLNNPGKAAILLNVFGVDAALQRRISHQALEILRPFLSKKAKPGFADELLPGADSRRSNAHVLCAALKHTYPLIEPALLSRFASTYGDISLKILNNVETPDNLGYHFGSTLYEREVIYLLENEWATCADDILKRRSLLGLELGTRECEKLDNWIQLFFQQYTNAAKKTSVAFAGG